MAALALVASLASCAKYGDLKDTADKINKSVETFKAAADKATDAAGAAKAFDGFANDMKSYSSAFNVFAKYSDDFQDPDLKLPDEVKKSVDKLSDTGRAQTEAVSALLEKYGDDAKLQTSVANYYRPLIDAANGLATYCAKFQTDAEGAKDGKQCADLIGGFGRDFPKKYDDLSNARRMYLELSYIRPPLALQATSVELQKYSESLSAGFQSIDTKYGSDAAVKKAYDERYKKLFDAVTRQYDSYDATFKSLPKAKDAKEVAAIIEKLAGELKVSRKTIMEEQDKLPELGLKMATGTLPENVSAALQKRPEEAVVKTASDVVEKYQDDPAVAKARAKLGAATM